MIGTALQTAFAKKIITQMLKKDTVPVIEINLEKNVEHGYTIHLIEKSEVALPALFTELIRLKSV